MPNAEEQLLSEKGNIEYWNKFYKKVRIEGESTFCTAVKQKFHTNAVILDVGCGSGRDAFSFAKEGYEVVGIDRSEEAIKLNELLRKDKQFKELNIKFYAVDISDKAELNKLIESVSSHAKATKKQLVVYVRFVLHSINEATEEILLSTLSKQLKQGDYLVTEFRTIEDKDLTKVYDNHYRRFIVAEDLLLELERKYNFTKVSFEKGTGMSIFNNEDPYLARIFMKKN